MENRLHTVVEVGQILGVNKNKVYSLIKKGYLKGLKLGSMKVSTYELNDFMKRNEGKDFTDFDNIKNLFDEEEV